MRSTNNNYLWMVLLKIFILPLYCQVNDCFVQEDTLTDELNKKTSSFIICNPFPNSVTYQTKYRLAETYIPDSTSKNKVIRVNFNIFQKSDGTGNFTTDSIAEIIQVFNWIRSIYLSNSPNSDPPSGVVVNDLSSKKIDFVLNGIYFYQDDLLYTANCAYFDQLRAKIKQTDSSRLNALNICITNGTWNTARGCINFIPRAPGTYSTCGVGSIVDTVIFQDVDLILLTFKVSGNPSTKWTGAQNIAHEIGHALGLRHTYCGGSPPMGLPICNITDTDYLYDVFGYPSTCPHIVSWSPSSTVSPTDKITNNLMGGNMDMNYLSPKQIGQCHRALYTLTTGKYTQCTYDSNHPWMVTNNETWDFSFRSFEDIYVSSGKILDINCTVQMTDSAKFVVSNGATVNVSSNGKIENRCGCNGNTFEISGTMNVSGILNVPMNTTINVYSSGILSVDSLCLAAGVQFNIYSGGKIFIRGIDYTNQLVQYNNQYNALINTPSVSGNIYAYNQIETQGNVTASGNTLFQAGRKIVLKSGFKAQSKFVARIDPVINTCVEQICTSGNEGNLQRRYNYIPEEKHFSEKEKIMQFRLLKNLFVLNPNPANTSVKITLAEKNTAIQKILLKDLTGKTLLQKESSTSSETLDISHLSDGLYFVVVQTTTGTHTEKLIVRH